MNRRCLMIVSATLLVSWSAIAIAQEPLKTASLQNGNPCSRFKLRVVVPDDGIDYKLITVKPDATVEYKGRVVTPCQPEGSGVAQSRPSPADPNSQAPSITPDRAPKPTLITPGLNRSLDAQGILKWRLEMLKQSQSPSGKK